MTSIPSWIFDPVVSTVIQQETEFIIYTDGSGPARNSPKDAKSDFKNEGGLGFVILKEETLLIQSGRKIVFDNLDAHTSELFAILEALRTAHFLNLDNEKIVLLTDSQHALARIYSNVIRIKDQIVVEEIFEIMKFFTNLKIKWIKGHSGNVWHDKADFLAKDSKKNPNKAWDKVFRY